MEPTAGTRREFATPYAPPAERASAEAPEERATAGWLARYWQLLLALVTIGVLWGTLTAQVSAKVDQTLYLRDKARADSLSGSILQEQRATNQRLDALLRYLCRTSSGPGC